jgi:hypothetical protein
VLALNDHPEKHRRLLNNPELMQTAIAEILRWISPVTHIACVSLCDTELGGQKIREGDWLALWISSANRDEAILTRHTISTWAAVAMNRSPSAKASISAPARTWRGWNCDWMLKAIAPWIEQIELAGKVAHLKSNVIPGIKHMPVRFSRPGSAA